MVDKLEANAFVTARTRAEERAKQLGENPSVKMLRAEALANLKKRKQKVSPKAEAARAAD